MKQLLVKIMMLAFVSMTYGVAMSAPVPRVVHPRIGDEAKAADGSVSLRLVNKRQNFTGDAATRCVNIMSPKSVNISPDGKKYYVNSLEKGETVAFDAATDSVVAVISHHIGEEHDNLWAPDRPDLYPFTHYKKNNHFMGKPVESTFTHGGRYLWVPYYRRSYDINAQDPSACAVIDTRTDKIIRLFETGPLPKMIATSPDGKYVAISHWGNNTVGLLDISSDKPEDWHHDRVLVVDYVLPLNYPLNRSVDRDNGSGYSLRGTVFTPDNKYLLVGCMGGSGGIAVIDVENGKYLGRVMGMMANVRHLVINGEYLYLSINGAGYVQRCKLDDFMDVARTLTGKGTTVFNKWENAKVGTGARTICMSPSGRFVFAACNNESALCVVDTRTMREVCRISVDSYPVGLDVSADGSRIYTTSQGRSGNGGNAVDIYEVTYAEPEVAPVVETPEAVDEQVVVDEQEDEPVVEDGDNIPGWVLPAVIVAAIVIVVGIFMAVRRRKH